MSLKEIRMVIRSFFIRKYEHRPKIFDVWCGNSIQFDEHILKKLMESIQFQELIGAQMIGNPEIIKIENGRMYILIWFKLPR